MEKQNAKTKKTDAMTTMEEGAREWTQELTRAWNDISHTTRRLQASFQDLSARAVEEGYVRIALNATAITPPWP